MGKFIDKTGIRYGNLIAIKHVGYNKRGNALFECKCDCGNVCVIPSGHLREEKPHTISCGCVRFMNRHVYIGLHKDLSGKKYGRLTVLKEDVTKFRPKNHVYLCKCDCGNQVFINHGDFRTTKSCGCYLSEKSKETMRKLPREKGRIRKLIKEWE